ncbi:unnamed protein product [Litomosoides sigmodontis]|uniref:SAM domain-containing protein n=1 Tax=Litomosoides sigmodontis TaxID=42156 RepID=A0A3P6SF81_LITSI|nr:unnamed protein product [Litomosoides sigmodontis]
MNASDLIWQMPIEEKLKCATTVAEVLSTLNMLQYLPLFKKANILEASDLRLLKEADLKCIGVDNSGRQKLLKAVLYLPKNAPLTAGERVRRGTQYARNVDSRHPKIDEEKFCLQKAEDELLRCKVELNLKRNELARIQKQVKVIREIFEMTINTRQYAQKVRSNCKECGALSVQRLAIDLESSLNNAFLPNANSNPSSKYAPPLSILQNINSKCPDIQQYLPELRLKSLTKHNTHLYYSNRIASDPWYAKILKSTTIRRYRQRPAVIYYDQPVDEGDGRCHESTVSLSTQPTSQHDHPSFVDGLFSRFGRNKTSIPCKQPSAAKRFSSNTTHQSFVRHSRQKVKNVFRKASWC